MMENSRHSVTQFLENTSFVIFKDENFENRA